MRTNALLQIFRQLPPKAQLGVGAVVIVVLGVLWLTGNLPDDGASNGFVNETTRTGSSRDSNRQAQGKDDRPARKSTSNAQDSRKSKPRKQATRQPDNRKIAANAGSIDAGDGDYDYLALALSWSPTYCETTGRGRNDSQCSGNRPYAFVLHGVWPQYNKGWPENCAQGQRPRVPNDVIREMLDIMPSRGLIIHEYRKHGTCTGLSAKGYYSLSRNLYGKIRIPPRYVRPNQMIRTSPRELEREFLKVNPQMTADMISVVCGRGERLKELRICFGRDGNLTRCGRNESQKKLCSRGSIRVPPVRVRR